MINIALYKPDIPQNTAAIVRLSACLDLKLHIIEPCGFNLDDSRFKRVAMDYINISEIIRYPDFETLNFRENQIKVIDNFKTLIAHDPFLTLQMGHFVRTKVARKHPFDAEMNTGEDFKYYLEIWKKYRCLKCESTFFHLIIPLSFKIFSDSSDNAENSKSIFGFISFLKAIN